MNLSHLYTATYDRGETRTIRGFEIPVTLPDKPPRRTMRNYGKREKEQKYERTVFPEWSALTPHEQENLVVEETHRRFNGEWWLIRGQEVYIPGWAHFFFNYWYAEWGSVPDFRMEAVDFFQVWDHCFRDPNCFGFFDVKGRRVGDTEKTLCLGYDLATRYRKSWFGQQNIKDDDAQANFLRIVEAHKRMQPWFRPVTPTTDDGTKTELVFDFPSSKTQSARDERQKTAQMIRGLGSRIDYRPTKAAEYDGKRLRLYYLDEIGKLDPKRMDAMKQWSIIKPALSLYNESWIVGKAIFTTTVENMKGGGSLTVCRHFWDGSDPSIRSANGRTPTGLYRYFRDYVLGYEPDEWGFPKEDEARAWRSDQVHTLTAQGNLEAVSDFCRKFPERIEDALEVPASDCPLLPELLQARSERLRYISEYGTPEQKQRLAVRGDLLWTDMTKTKVRWVPNQASGKWYISHHPEIPNNVVTFNGLRRPGNRGMFYIGVDPIDHTKTEANPKGSKGGIAVYMPFNTLFERHLQIENGEIINIEDMRTDQFVCTYKHRPHNPNDLYDDVLKTMVYYGASAFIERDKPGVIAYIQGQGYSPFLDFKPRELKIGVTHEKEPGAKTTAQLTTAFIDGIKEYIATRISNCYHPMLLDEWRNYTGENMTKCDLLVAAGYAKLMDMRHKINPRANQKRELAKPPWFR